MSAPTGTGRAWIGWGDALAAQLRPVDPVGADAVVRRQVSFARRLDLVALAGGTGCSHLAARLAVLLAWRRRARVLAVDAGTGAALSRLTQARAPAHPAREFAEPQPGRRHHAPVSMNSLDQAGMLTGRAGVRVLRPAAGLAPVRPQDWQSTVAAVSRHFDLIVTDWGRRAPGIDLEAALAGSRAVLVVCRADRYAVEAALGLAGQLGPAALVCAVDVDGVGRRAVRAARRWGQPVPFLPFLPDPAVAVPPAAVRWTVIEVAAALVERATAGGGP